MREGTVIERVDHILEWNDLHLDMLQIPEQPKTLSAETVLRKLLSRRAKRTKRVCTNA